MNQRPTFFISSTIYDFSDLRSAIKFYLESLGCEVLASEYNDFGVNSKSHSYQACLDNIQRADYFVLLIGSRIGGWYDEASRVSITMQEYREAYRLHTTENLKIITLVRKEIWDLKEDRKALERHLKSLPLSDEQRREIARFPSKFAEDADFVAAFLREVGRIEDTKAAQKAGTPMPTGNWIFPFTTFQNVLDVLVPLTFKGATAEDAAYRRALQFELIGLVRRLLIKFEDEIIDPRGIVTRFWQQYPIFAENLSGTTAVKVEDWNKFSLCMYRLLGAKIQQIVINDALTSPIFLEYDPTKSGYVDSEAYRMLSQLVDEIDMFNRSVTAETLSLVNAFSRARTGKSTGTHNIPSDKLAVLLHAALRWHNVIAICEALAKHLAGQPFGQPTLLPFSAVQGLDIELANETVSIEEARKYFDI